MKSEKMNVRFAVYALIFRPNIVYFLFDKRMQFSNKDKCLYISLPWKTMVITFNLQQTDEPQLSCEPQLKCEWTIDMRLT